MSSFTPDTQPRSPFKGEPINLTPDLRPDEERGGRGGSCLLTGLIVGMLLFVAVVIVALAAAAGWTSGQREASVGATATQNAAIGEQLQHIPDDVSSGNVVLLDARIRWLATQTPGVPGVGDLVMTATALYLNTLPTATPIASPTPAATEAATAAQDNIAITPESSGGYDLASLLAQAQTAMASSQWENAIELLDVIMGTDATFQTQTVRGLMSQALNSYAKELYNNNQPAQANTIVDRAEEFGPLAEGLAYERYAAELFLTARAGVGTGNPRAISALQELINQGSGGRYYSQALQLLYTAYVAQGDATYGQGDACSAAMQYQRAVNLLPSGAANGKLVTAQNACANATPTTDPNLVLSPEPGVAPVGQVGG